ncbi:MAG: DUF4168 domain-containing protein [Cyanobacteria bacterium RM1_2_2]|nr:DUF4168 domain-containing protein [Cyanobacteria bacterium RM1_2_2]
MLTASRSLSQLDLQRRLMQVLVVSTLSTVGLLLGIVPSFKPAPDSSMFHLTLSHAAYAQAGSQAVSNDEVQSYARSVLAIEPIRVKAYEEIQKMTGSDDVPVVACHRPSSLSELPENIRDVAIDYCNQAIAIVERNNLTITRFNQITIAHQNNRGLSDRIQQVINQIQNGG